MGGAELPLARLIPSFAVSLRCSLLAAADRRRRRPRRAPPMSRLGCLARHGPTRCPSPALIRRPPPRTDHHHSFARRPLARRPDHLPHSRPALGHPRYAPRPLAPGQTSPSRDVLPMKLPFLVTATPPCPQHTELPFSSASASASSLRATLCDDGASTLSQKWTTDSRFAQDRSFRADLRSQFMPGSNSLESHAGPTSFQPPDPAAPSSRRKKNHTRKNKTNRPKKKTSMRVRLIPLTPRHGLHPTAYGPRARPA